VNGEWWSWNDEFCGVVKKKMSVGDAGSGGNWDVPF
jgi:hypothetical protein